MNSKKLCTGCKKRFPADDLINLPGGNFHTIQCAIDYTNKKKLVAAKKKKAVYKKETTRLKREYRDNDRSFLTEKAQKACNAYIRERDHIKPCVSCGTTKDIQYCAGHFKTRGAHSELRFNEYNIFKQCNQNCNLKLSGNIVNYRPELIKRIGIKHVEFLEASHTPYKYSLDELREIELYYKDKLKEL